VSQDTNEFIKSDTLNKTVNPEKQSQHIRGSNGYIQGRSYLLDGVDAQELVDRYSGTGDIHYCKASKRISKEVVRANRDIGVRINPETGEETLTNKFTIHYSKTGTHIVPARRRP